MWYCEDHPDKEMGHDGCDGAGIPECARISMLVLQKRLLAQELFTMKRFFGQEILILTEIIKNND